MKIGKNGLSLLSRLAALCVCLLTLVMLFPNVAQAHQSGCHRWHSCPSDSGSYVCGDTGHYSECPGYNAQPTPQPVQQPVAQPTAQPIVQTIAQPILQPVATAAPIAPVPSILSTGTVSTDMLNVRSGPSTDFPTIGSLAQGSRITILERNNGWLRTEYQGDANGWVFAEFIAEDQPSAAVTSAPDSVVTSPSGYAQPILISPIKQASAHDPLQFEWEWAGTLADGHGFDVQIWKEGESPAGITHPSFVVAAGGNHYTVKVQSIQHPKGAVYFWTVRIVQVDSGQDVGPSAASNTFRYE